MQTLFDKSWKYSLFMKNPKERAGIFSRLFFSWMNGFINIGNKRVLEHSDFYPLLEEDKSKPLTDKLEQAWLEEIRKSHTRERKVRLFRAMLKTLPWTDYALMGISLFIGVACNILQPLFLGLLLSLLLQPGAESQHRWLYLYTGGLCCSSLVRILVMNQYQSKVNFMGMRWRIAVIGVIYKKVRNNAFGRARDVRGDARYFKGRGWMADTIMPLVGFGHMSLFCAMLGRKPLEAYFVANAKAPLTGLDKIGLENNFRPFKIDSQ